MCAEIVPPGSRILPLTVPTAVFHKVNKTDAVPAADFVALFD